MVEGTTWGLEGHDMGRAKAQCWLLLGALASRSLETDGERAMANSRIVTWGTRTALLTGNNRQG